MFIGHYGVAFAVKAKAPSLRLWHLFLAVQALDLLFAVFLLVGVEHMSVETSSPSRCLYDVFHLYDMGLSHSLVGAIVWGALVALLARIRVPWNVAAWLGAALFSHFVLDIPMHPNDALHPPDLTLAGKGTPGVGLGLWNTPIAAVALEILTFAVGVALYARANRPLRPRMWVLVAVFIGFGVLPLFMPPSGTPITFAVQVLAMCIVLALWVAWAERTKVLPSHGQRTEENADAH
jgi:hypothetical protein